MPRGGRKWYRVWGYLNRHGWAEMKKTAAIVLIFAVRFFILSLVPYTTESDFVIENNALVKYIGSGGNDDSR